MKKHNHDDDDEMTPEEKEQMKRYVDELILSGCEQNAPRVYVVELMRLVPEKRRRGMTAALRVYGAPMSPVLSIVERLALKVYHAPVSVENGVERRNLAILSDAGSIENLGLTGETVWLRGVDADEVFLSADKYLLLRPREIVEINSDFVLAALEKHLSDNGMNARLAVIHAASELLLAHLNEDICLIPDRFDDVIEAINAVLNEADWTTLTEDGVLRLTDKVIQRVKPCS